MGNLALRGALIALAGACAGLVPAIIAWSAGASPLWWLGLAAVAIVVAALIGYRAFLATHEAVRGVVTAVSRIGEAEFGQRVAVASGPAAELTTSFNTMARRVQQLFRDIDAEHARLEAVFDASTDAMVALSRDNEIRYLNATAVVMLGMSFESSLGRPLIEAVRDYELDALVRRVASSGGRGETAVVTYGPRRTPLRAVAVPIPGGGDWAVLLVLTDLTEVNRVDQVRRDFLSNVSHELRTPLASIRALAETLESGNVDPGPETEEFVRRIRRQVDHLTALVNELLDLSRIESGAVELRPGPIDLGSLVAESIALLNQRAEAERITIIGPEQPGIRIEGDHASLLRVVNNLLDNAIKYSPPGSTVTVTARDEGELVALSVADEGPGIAPQDLPRVFERFYKGDPSRTNSASAGIGLGLAIVKHTVRLHGGTVEVESPPGRGAIFTVRLPKAFAGPRAIARR